MSSTINADNGVVSGSVGLKYASDNSGVLALQTNGNTAVTIDATGNIGVGTSSPGSGIKLDVLGGEIRAGRVDSSYEGGQVSLSRSTDNATAWYFDVYGNTSTPSLRVVDVSSGAVRASIDSSGNLQYNSGYGSTATAYACRVCANFTGAGSINGSGNVTSVTKNGTGDYSIFFTNNMPDANYSYQVAAQRVTNNNGDGPKCGVYYGGVQTGSLRVLIPRQTSNAGETYDTNWTNISIAVFR